MSARAWERRRRGKRFRIAVLRALDQLRADPELVVELPEFGLVVMGVDHYDRLQADIATYRDLAQSLLASLAEPDPADAQGEAAATPS